MGAKNVRSSKTVLPRDVNALRVNALAMGARKHCTTLYHRISHIRCKSIERKEISCISITLCVIATLYFNTFSVTNQNASKEDLNLA